MDDNKAIVRALDIGTILNSQYTIIEVLGIGGFGITYLCVDNFLKMNVAIKEFFPTQIASRDITSGTNIITASSSEYEKMYKKGLEDYEYEANKLAKFTGLDGVVSVLNFFFENGTAYMVMEHIEGISLKKYLNNRSEKISWNEMLLLMKPAFASMKLIHDAGIIHRDISPDNIIISNDNRLTIIDFGSAKNNTDGADTSITLKHGYAPPEQYYLKGNQGPWTDVYALCATMYRMLTGKRPPKSIDVRSGLKQIHGVREFDSTIPVWVENAIMDGLRSEVEDRIHSVAELEQQLYPAEKQCKTGIRLVLGVSIIAVVCLIIAGGLFFLINSSEDQSESDRDDFTTETVAEKDTTAQSQRTAIEEFENLPEIELDKITYEIQDGYVVINKLDVSITRGRLPSIIDGKTVKVINGSGRNITNIMIPEGVETIGEEAFKNCVYLETIYIPSTVKTISKKAFVNCKSIRKVSLAEDNDSFYIKGQGLYTSDGDEVLAW